MTDINIPTGWDEELKSRLEWFTPEQKDKLLEMLKQEKKETNDSKEDIDLWEDFEKIDLGAKVDRIFEKLWDTDRAADLIINLITSPIKNYWDKKTWIGELTMWFQNSYKNKIMKAITWETNKEPLAENKDRYFKIKDKFWSWPVALRLSLFMLDEFNRTYRDIGMQKAFYEDRNSKKNVTERTLKEFLEWSDWAKAIARDCLQ